MRVLISFNLKDVALAEAIRASLFVVDCDLEIVLSPASYGAVFWRANIANGISEVDAFVLLIGPNGIGPWQEVEYHIALNRHMRDGRFAVVPIIAAGSQVPRASFLRSLNFVEAPVITDRSMLRRLVGALKGELNQ